MSLDVSTDDQLLVRVLRDPAQLCQLSPEAFGRVIDAAEEARLLGWLWQHADKGLMPASPPRWLVERLVTVRALVDEYDRGVLWEVDRLQRALGPTGIRWMLLKGAAYLAAGLSPGRGRRVADIDLLVHEQTLPDVERALLAHGWEFPTLDAYDNRFYRQWMHESPPMVHRQRLSVVDAHHAILPRTSRLHPPTERILERAMEVQPGVFVPCPSHLVLHAAAHLFHDGEISGAVRDLVDLQGLLVHFDAQPGFWSDLVAEAERLDLRRPAFYAVRYAQRLLDAPAPPEVVSRLATWGPPAALRVLMDRLVARAIPDPAGHGSSVAALALYIRSHWLRMPPGLLARHLLRKASRSE
jgi:hypothetical protein